jgi:hypothetical protein
MTAALFLLLLNWRLDTTGQLSQCVEQKDQKCVSALLINPLQNASPEYLAVAARGYMLLNRSTSTAGRRIPAKGSI